MFVGKIACLYITVNSRIVREPVEIQVEKQCLYEHYQNFRQKKSASFVVGAI